VIIVGSNASPELDASAPAAGQHVSHSQQRGVQRALHPGMRERNVLAREEETAFQRNEVPV